MLAQSCIEAAFPGRILARQISSWQVMFSLGGYGGLKRVKQMRTHFVQRGALS
jgi:hypothetical protein